MNASARRESNHEQPMTTKLKLSLVAGLFGTLAIPFLWSSGETVTFRVIDRNTGKPLTNAFVAISERWTKLPVEKLQISKLTRSRRRIIHGENGQIRVRGLPSKPDYHFQLTLLSRDHYQAIFTRTDCDRINYPSDDRLTEELPTRKKIITVALEPVSDPRIPRR
jgi:hypothetical protein